MSKTSAPRKKISIFDPSPEPLVEEALQALVTGTADQAALERINADPKLQLDMLCRCSLHRLIGKKQGSEFNEEMAALVLRVFGAQTLLEYHPSAGPTPLMWACQAGNVKGARFLLDAGAKVNSKDRHPLVKPSTPLGSASAKLAGEELIELLIARGADPNQRDEADPGSGELPLIKAINATTKIRSVPLPDKARGTIKALLRHTRWGRQYCESVLGAVFQSGHLVLLKLLLECDDELKDYVPPTCEPVNNAKDPLSSLLKQISKPIEWLDLLLANRHKFGTPFDVDVALHESLRQKSGDEVVTALLRHGADVHKPTSDTSETPIFLAYRHGCSETVIKFLLDAAAATAGADEVNAAASLVTDPYGRNELHALAMEPVQNMKRLASLLERGIDPRQKDIAGNSVYIYAAVHKASWMLGQLVNLLAPRPGDKAQPALGGADDNDSKQRISGEQSWMEEQVEWNLRRPITRAMKEHLDNLLTINRSKQQRDGTSDCMKVADAAQPMDEVKEQQPASSASPRERQPLSEQQRQVVETLAADEKAVVAPIVEVVEDGEWTSRNAAYETCLRALGDRFVKLRGRSILYLIVTRTYHDDLARRVMQAKPELALMPHGAEAKTLLETAAERSKRKMFRRMLITLQEVNLAIPADLRQRVMRCLLPKHNMDKWESNMRALMLLGPVDVNEPDPESRLPLLHQALKHRCDLLIVVTTLLRLGADVNAKDKSGRTALFCAYEEEPLKLLLAAGADLDVFGTRKLMRNGKAVRKKQSALSLIGDFFSKEAALAVVTYCAHVSPAHIYYLVLSDLTYMARALLLKLRFERASELADYFKQPDHKSPLWAVAKCSPISSSHLKLIRIMRDMDYQPPRKNGMRFLWRLLLKWRARNQRQAELLQLILPFCAADLCEFNKHGQSCFDVATITGNNHFFDALAHLTSDSTTAHNSSQGSSSSSSSSEGSSLSRQREEELRRQARKLMSMRNAKGQTALLAAVRPHSFASQANLALVQSVIKAGSDINAQETGTGNTALHHAAKTNSIALCKLLLDSGGEIDVRNEAGETPLFAAARLNHWHTTLFLLLSGADAHATNKAGQCVLMASSALSAAVIHDFVTRPRSLDFIAGRLLPLHCADIDVASLITAVNLSPIATPSSNAAVGAEGDGVSLAPIADEMSIEVSAIVPPQHEQEQLQPLGASFPEIIIDAVSPATIKEKAADGDDNRMALEAEPTNNASVRRHQQRQAVAQVTALLERVLETLQLYHGAPAETDPAVPRADNEEDPEADRLMRWERNESLVTLKNQLTGWLKASKARIPRITRNLSFSTLSEGEMTLYLRQWKALQQRQKLGVEDLGGGEGRKRKRFDGREAQEEEDCEPQSSSQGDDDKHTIDVKRPRLTQSGDGDDDDLPPEPCLVVPEMVGVIPLPRPFLSPTDQRSVDQPIGSVPHAEAMIQRTAALVHDAIKASVVHAVRRQMSGEAAQLNVGLLADDQGYLLGAFLTRPPQVPLGKFERMALQAVVALPSDQCDDRAPYYAVRQTTADQLYVADETTEVFKTHAEAVAEFDKRFKALTGHAWADRSQQQSLPVGSGGDSATGSSESTPAITEIDEEEAAMAAPTTASDKYLYLPTNHEAVLLQLGHAERDENLATKEAKRVLARLPKPGEADARSDEERVFDLLSFVSSKHQIFSYCQRVGLLKEATLGQLSAAQLKNAFDILNVIADILTYEEELKRRGRALPPHVELTRQNLSHAFHCVLPFDFTATTNDLVNSVVMDNREKLNQKADILQSLQEIGIGMEVLHETSLPRKHTVVPDALADAVAQSGAVVTADDGQTQQADKSSSHTSSDGKESKAARMRLLYKALCTKLTPLNKRSDEWRMIMRIIKPDNIIDAFAVEREGEAERYRPYANLPNRMLLGHGTGVANVMGILRKGLCVSPLGAKKTGSTLGKGLYFSDQPEKSLKYMKWGKPKVGCFLLCETALGEALIRRSTKGATTLPPGRHHSLGLGQKSYDPSVSLHTDEGVMIPIGVNPVQSAIARLSHNEFVLPNEDQVRIRYLLFLRA